MSGRMGNRPIVFRPGRESTGTQAEAVLNGPKWTQNWQHAHSLMALLEVRVVGTVGQGCLSDIAFD